MSLPDDDTLLGIAVLALFVPAVIVLGWVIYRVRDARLQRAWRPLLPLFDGARVGGDGGGAAASFLGGRYRGRRVEATMFPRVAAHDDSDGGGPYLNLFQLSLPDVAGSADWRVVLPTDWLGRPVGGWQLESPSAALGDALQRAGVLETLQALVPPDATMARHGPALAFRSRESRLVLRCEVGGPGLVPPPAWVEQALALLLKAAESTTAPTIGPTVDARHD